MINYIEITKKKFENIILTEKYDNNLFGEIFNKHLKDLFKIANFLNKNAYTDIITQNVYWQTEATILEHLDDVKDEIVLNELDNLENTLYENIKKALGENYIYTSELKKIIDYTIHCVILSVKFN